MTTTTPTVWFLDVDGVLNSDRNPPPRLGGPYTPVDITLHPGETYTIWYDPHLIDRINTLTRTGNVHILWLTTWEHHAVTDLTPALGLDTHPVATPPPGTPVSDTPDLPGTTTPWWKTATVHNTLKSLGQPKFIWTDDELRRHTKKLIRAAHPQPHQLITPMPTPGLTHAQLDTITTFTQT